MSGAYAGGGYGSDFLEDAEGDVTWNTCRERLNEARNALHELMMGRQVQVVSHDGRTVTYVGADASRIQAYITRLCQSCPDGYASEVEFNAKRRRGRAHVVTWHR